MRRVYSSLFICGLLKPHIFMCHKDHNTFDEKSV